MEIDTNEGDFIGVDKNAQAAWSVQAEEGTAEYGRILINLNGFNWDIDSENSENL